MDNFFDLNLENGYSSGDLGLSGTPTALDRIYTAFGVSGSISKSGFSSTGYVSQGIFIVKSLYNDNNTPSNFGNQLYMHFTNKTLNPIWASSGTGNTDDHDLIYYFGYDESKFDTVLKIFRPYTEANDSYNLWAMYYANNIREYGYEGPAITNPVTCNIKSLTNDYMHDLWSHDLNGSVRDMPVIAKYRDRVYNDDTRYIQDSDPSVSHVQQASFSINAVSTNISDIGSSTWGKKIQTFYEDVADHTSAFGDGNSKSYWYYNSHTSQFINDTDNNYMHNPSTKSIMLDLIIKTPFTDDSSQDFVYGVNELDNNNNDNYHRTPVDWAQNSNLKTTKMFNLYSQASYVADAHYYMYCPILFSRLSSSTTTYGRDNVFKTNSDSYKNIFGLANVVATSFGGPYTNFVIYKTNDQSSTYFISYAIDLRPIVAGGSAIPGKTFVTVGGQTSDVLAIANCNIYVLSTAQVRDFIHGDTF